MSINGVEYLRGPSPTTRRDLIRVKVEPTRAPVVAEFRTDFEIGTVHRDNIWRAIEMHDELVAMIQALLDWAPGTHNRQTDSARELLGRARA